MHGLAVGENDDAQPPTAGFVYSRPAPNAAIRLHALMLGMGDYSSNPGIAD